MSASVSERLAQEDQILREIRLTLTAYKSTMGAVAPRRKGAVYASSPITSGLRLYQEMKRLGIRNSDEFRSSPEFRSFVMEPNLKAGADFGERLRKKGWHLVIVPGEFFAKGWAQEHYMSLWRQVIVRFARTVAMNTGWMWSLGSAEEFLIGLQSGKRIVDANGNELPSLYGAKLVREAIDTLDARGFDPKPLYELWRQIDLTREAIAASRRVDRTLKTVGESLRAGSF